MGPDDAIRVDGLVRRFGSVTAVDGLSFTVARGEVFGVLGPNGAGKTTTLRVLCGVLAPSAGAVRVFGLDPLNEGPRVRRATGVLTAAPALYDRLTARENLTFFGALYDVPADDLPGRVARLLDLFDLTGRAGDRAGGFSTGMRQRLALARALLHEPPLLLLDEPTSGLDPEAARQVSGLVERLSRREGRTVVLCTHNLDEAQRLCDRVAVLDAGRLLALGTPAELARELWAGRWVDIDLATPPSPAMLGGLRRIEDVLETDGGGARLSVQVRTDRVIPAVVAHVVREGGQVMAVAPREYTLEQVYFELRRRREGAAAQ
ncbi:MAG: ABC transporter ATP-binding protein [Dehalococcoidia bacterium]